MTPEQAERLGTLACDRVEWLESGRGQYLPGALEEYVDSLLAAERAAVVAECATEVQTFCSYCHRRIEHPQTGRET